MQPPAPTDPVASENPVSSTPPSADPLLAELGGFIQDGRHYFVPIGGKQVRVDRATPMGIALAGLQAAGNAEYWRIALGRGVREGIALPSDAEEIGEEPQKLSLLARIFGRKPAPRAADREAKLLIPGVPDYEKSAEALGIQAAAHVTGVRIHASGPRLMMSDGKEILPDSKGGVARSVAILLEEYDAMGENHARARAVVNAPLNRPVVAMSRFGGKPATLRPSEASNALSETKTRATKRAPSSAPGAGESDGWDNFDGPAHVEIRDLAEPGHVEISSFTPQPASSSSPLEAPNPVASDEPDLPPTPEVSFEVSKPVTRILQTEHEPAQPAELSRVTAEAEEPESPADGGEPDESLAPESAEAAGTPPADADDPKILPEPPPVPEAQMAPVTVVEQLPMPIGEAANLAAGAHWSAGLVRIGQRARPKPGGPYSLEARGRDKQDGKYVSLGQFNVSKQDYEVVQWLAKTNREAIYKVSVKEQSGEEPSQGLPEAHIEGVEIKNETTFAPVNWKMCREEFERANNLVQSPERREAMKSAVIETAVSTPLIPVTLQPARPRAEDIKQGGMPALPRLRRLSVPVAQVTQRIPSR
jgi:hypothetical protein